MDNPTKIREEKLTSITKDLTFDFPLVVLLLFPSDRVSIRLDYILFKVSKEAVKRYDLDTFDLDLKFGRI